MRGLFYLIAIVLATYPSVLAAIWIIGNVCCYLIEWMWFSAFLSWLVGLFILFALWADESEDENSG